MTYGDPLDERGIAVDVTEVGSGYTFCQSELLITVEKHTMYGRCLNIRPHTIAPWLLLRLRVSSCVRTAIRDSHARGHM